MYCNRQFIGGNRLYMQRLINEDIEGKQTICQLSQKYNVNKSTIWRRLKNMRHIRCGKLAFSSKKTSFNNSSSIYI